MSTFNLFKPAIFIAMMAGVAAGSIVTFMLLGKGASVDEHLVADKQPLYWVAPMDANYQRDKPGLSPMGMELVPVYDTAPDDLGEGPGTVIISPSVVNNLGVRTGLVERRELHREIITVGYVQYDEERLVHIHPRVSGWIEKLYVKATGDPVKKNAPLYSLYSPELVNAQEELLLAINRNNTRLVTAAKERMRALHISDSFIDTLVRDQNVQQTVTFMAPQDGVVDNLNIREGFYVQPGTTLLSVGALDSVWVEGEVFERQASLVAVHDRVAMTLDYLPGESWEGVVEYIYPTLNSETRTARVRLSFDNPNGVLKPNMFVQLSIQLNNRAQRLVIPREALIRTGDQDRVVLALGEGRFKSIAVKVGIIDQGFAEILEGLTAGERVVTSAQFLLDSESSKHSDFTRLLSEQSEQLADESVWVSGHVISVQHTERNVTVSHAPIATWGWPEMTMDFNVATPIDLSLLTPNATLRMNIHKTPSGEYVIIQVDDIASPVTLEHTHAIPMEEE
ncbi:efflux RND transporter periplasmic adaptor subunit [Teredinibacter purpureus]|uniref:efflux RND transporter periplasmic adaptor subunit n=1 Tax=Teredinibacter purpureus TaxID=2731756 RepID=UPI00069793EB|nr:efflux RND transporter periplasmic adaptor subunit [Teredinibacter purpureus]